MSRTFIVVGLGLALALACCHPPETGTGGTAGAVGSGSTSSECPPPCPEGATWCAADPFCNEPEHAGEPCCHPPDGGVCQAHECALCGPQAPAFEGSGVCFEPTCCETSPGQLALACTEPLMPHPVVCTEAPMGGTETDNRHCVPLELTLKCAWGEGDVFVVLCCEEPVLGT